MVPEDFRIVQIEECLTDSKAMAYGILQPGSEVDDGVPMIRTVDIGADGLSGTRIIKVSKELHHEYRRTALKGGEVILSVMGTVGRTMVVPKSCSGWNVNRALAVMRLSDKVDAFYFSEYLKSPFINDRLVEQAIGSAQKRINLGDLRKYELNLPPLLEQRKIANILGTWDKAISITERLIDNSKQQKKALMQQLLTGKKRLLDDSGKPFECEWEDITIGSTSKCFSGGTPSRSKEEYYGGDIPWITSGKLNDRFVTSVNEYISELGLKNSSAKVVKNGSLLIAMYGATAGKVAINKLNGATVNQAVLALEPNKHCHNLFLFYLFEVEMVKALKLVQGGQPNLSAAIIKGIKIKLPSVSEQLRIAEVITNADKEVELLEQQLSDLKQEKKALMQQLLTGKRRVKVDNTEAA